MSTGGKPAPASEQLKTASGVKGGEPCRGYEDPVPSGGHAEHPDRHLSLTAPCIFSSKAPFPGSDRCPASRGAPRREAFLATASGAVLRRS